MAIEHTVGLRLHDRSTALTIEAEDALIAALKAKHEHPEASITYVQEIEPAPATGGTRTSEDDGKNEEHLRLARRGFRTRLERRAQNAVRGVSARAIPSAGSHTKRVQRPNAKILEVSRVAGHDCQVVNCGGRCDHRRLR